MDKNLKRVQLVARHFRELQGLRMSLFGGVFALAFGTYVLAPPAEGSGGIWIALAAALLVIVPCQRVVERYYESTFGRVTPAPSNNSSWKSAAVLAGLVLTGMALKLPPLAAALPFVVCSSLWIVIRDWPFRVHHLAGVGAALSATLLLMTPAAVAAPDASTAAALLLFGVAYVPVGLLDHRLLVSLMHGAPNAADGSEREIEAERARRN